MKSCKIISVITKENKKMKLSPLQISRYQYNPKLPGMLRHGVSEICVKEGEATQSVADQEKIKSLFPNTYGKKEITFQKVFVVATTRVTAGASQILFVNTDTG